jgi:receptor protein-tyrosine kinase
MFTQGQQSLAEDRLKSLQDELGRAQADRIARQSQYSLVGPSQADTITDAPAVRDYDSKIADLRRQLADMESLMTPENYKVVRLKAQLEQLEAARRQEVQHLQQRLQNDYKSAESREQSLAQSYAHQSGVVQGLSDKIMHYNNLKHEVDTNRQFYESMLQRINEAGIASAVRQSNIRLVGPADLPLKPYKPNVMFNLGMGAFLSLVLGVGLVLYQEQGNQSLRAPGEAGVYLRLPELGAIPKFEHRISLPQRLLGAGNGQRSLARITQANRLSFWSESFRGAVTSILSNSASGDYPHVLVLTSALPMEGKTTVTSNLGIALAEISERVLLIDADVRAPRLHKLFNLDNSWGLSDLLADTDHAEERPLETLVQATASPNLFVLPSGPTTERIFGLLHSDHMERLMARFRREFQYVLLDAPPCLQVADARILGKHADGVVLVVRANHVNKKMALAAAQRLLADGIPVLGTILNDWDLAADRDYGYGYGYGYGSGKRAS